jgi:hypothetical protein
LPANAVLSMTTVVHGRATFERTVTVIESPTGKEAKRQFKTLDPPPEATEHSGTSGFSNHPSPGN